MLPLWAAACSSSPASSAHPANTRTIRTIPVGIGSPPLTGTLTLPAGRGPFPAVVLVGGSGPNDQDETIGPDKPFLDLAQGLAAGGIASLRYDKRTKDYPGDLDLVTFTPTQEYVPDAVAAIGLLRSRPEVDPARVFVLGHSQGGTFAPLIAKTAPEVAGLIMLAAGAQPFGATLVRQITYLASLPGTIGSEARAELPAAEQAEAEIDSPDLATEAPTTHLSSLLGGTGPAYWLDLRRYDPVATARARPQPMLFLQGDRDYQVTIANDLDVWTAGLAGRSGITVHTYVGDDHLFIPGSGPPSPADYDHAGHVDGKVIADIIAWVHAQK